MLISIGQMPMTCGLWVPVSIGSCHLVSVKRNKMIFDENFSLDSFLLGPKSLKSVIPQETELFSMVHKNVSVDFELDQLLDFSLKCETLEVRLYILLFKVL